MSTYPNHSNYDSCLANKHVDSKNQLSWGIMISPLTWRTWKPFLRSRPLSSAQLLQKVTIIIGCRSALMFPLNLHCICRNGYFGKKTDEKNLKGTQILFLCCATFSVGMSCTLSRKQTTKTFICTVIKSKPCSSSTDNEKETYFVEVSK